ncbi:MAG TPA: phenylacetic acid degradation operon negative regulatory protein PaaX [Acidimicrobiales bacterium]|nr:phenylacetic acid degradation operon negative regulatory protein PaaX [Acidimicrobiales bacterium]
MTEAPARLERGTRSLLITIFGDSIMPRGGSVWLGSLISLAAELGVNERLVRTTMNRLSVDGWFETEQRGRRSYYRPTPGARADFEAAEQRIYHRPVEDWNGSWTLVMVGTEELPAGERADLRRRLGWSGFRAVAPNVMGHPTVPPGVVGQILSEHRVESLVPVVEGVLSGVGADARDLVRRAFSLDGLEEGYAEFISTARRWAGELDHGEPPPPRAWEIHTRMVHLLRRLRLADPLLPADLLPGDWIGTRAFELAGEIHRLTDPAADEHLSNTAENAEGPLSRRPGSHDRRFASGT